MTSQQPNAPNSSQLPPAPIFGVMGNEQKIGKTGIISLVDIFDEFLFSNDKNTAQPQRQGEPDKSAGGALSHNDEDGDDDSYDDGDETEDGKKRKRSRGIQRNMTEEQKVERRYDYVCIWMLLRFFSYPIYYFNGLF